MKFTTIDYEVRERVAIITLNRPHVLNAINRALADELLEALEAADLDESVRVVVLRGAGRAFSAGADLKERATSTDVERDPEKIIAGFRRGFAYMKIWEMSKPVIASVHGYCLAGACQMVGVCDLTIASDDAVFGEPEVKFVNPILLPITPLLLGLKKSKEFLYLGEPIDAREAERLGMVNRVVPRAALEQETWALAQKIAALPPGAIQLNKRAINRIWELMGMREAAHMNEEILAYLFAYQSLSGQDEGFRERVRQRGLKAALGETQSAD